MPTFVLRLIAPRPNFAQTLTDSERVIMGSHAAYWRPYLDRGDMVAFGPVLTDDDSYGLAIVETDDEWITMWKTNVLGLMWMTRACLPLLRKAKHGHIVNIGSIAGFETYKGGAGYTAVKHGVRAITKTLRLELNGEPIRITEIAPGLVETEFSVVRFHGDRKAARAVYEGLKPLTAEDVADCVLFAVTRPAHVDIDEIVVRPVAQATASVVARKPRRAGH